MSDGQKYYSDAQRKSQLKWNQSNLERLSLSFKRGHRGKWEAAANREQLTLTQWVLKTLDAAAADLVPDDDPGDV